MLIFIYIQYHKFFLLILFFFVLFRSNTNINNSRQTSTGKLQSVLLVEEIIKSRVCSHNLQKNYYPGCKFKRCKEKDHQNGEKSMNYTPDHTVCLKQEYAKDNNREAKRAAKIRKEINNRRRNEHTFIWLAKSFKNRSEKSSNRWMIDSAKLSVTLHIGINITKAPFFPRITNYCEKI